MKSQLSFVPAYLILTVSCILVTLFPATSTAESMLLMTVPSIIAATSPLGRLNSYGSQQQCLWGEGDLCDKEYDNCIKEMNEMATRLEQDCYQRLSSCTASCGGNQICIDFCIKDFETCTAAAQNILRSKQSECNANLEKCYDKAIETCFDLPVSLTELYPRWYLAR